MNTALDRRARSSPRLVGSRRAGRLHHLTAASVRRVVSVVVGLLLLTVPFAGALVAIRYAPPTRIEVAGQPVSVKPVIGQDTSRLQNGAVVRPEHAHVDFLDKDIGVDIEADWNRLIPSDRSTRRYLVSLWADPQPQIARIESAARGHLTKWGVTGFGSGIVLVVGAVLGLRRRRRRFAGYAPRDARLIRDHNRWLTLAAFGLSLVAILATDLVAAATYLHVDHHVVVSDPVFDGTTLEGTEVEGLIAQTLPFFSILVPRTTFYDTVAANLEAAVEAEPTLQRTAEEKVFVLAEDFEDVNGMARQVGLTADLVDADFIALSGDLTFAGKAIESYIIDTVDYYSGDLPVYLAPGLHDTQPIVQAAEKRGWHVADGSTVDVDGLSLLSVADPRISTVGSFGTDDVLRDPDVDVDTFVADTVGEACETEPDFILLHDHRLGRQIAEAGCHGPAVLDGRSYGFVGPQSWVGAGGQSSIEFTSGSAGGHVSTSPNPGAIKHPARYTVFMFDSDTGDTHYFVFTVEPDASVSVTPAIELSVPYESYLATGRTEPD